MQALLSTATLRTNLGWSAWLGHVLIGHGEGRPGYEHEAECGDDNLSGHSVWQAVWFSI
jgi:hypothetical protein